MRRQRSQTRGAIHERMAHDETVKGSSDRGFGVVFTVVFLVIGLWPLVAGEPLRLWALAVAGVLLGVALLRPGLLAPANRLWLAFGLALHKVVNPLVLGFLFFLTITPMAIVMRLLGKDLLHLRRDAEAKSYWIERRPPGPAPDTMKHQF